MSDTIDPVDRYNLNVGIRISVSQHISAARLETTIQSGTEDAMKEGFIAYISGLFERKIREDAVNMIENVEQQARDQWDKMVKAHKEGQDADKM